MNFMRRFMCTFLAVLWLAAPAGSTVNSAVNKTIALGNGSQTQFTFSFIGVAAAYITVILTDSSGNETVLTQGSGTTQYTISLSAPVQGAIWGTGGTIIYNPSGTPIPAGSTLTIFRTLPLTQAITLQNQASIATLGKGAETGLDTGVMQGQQINEQISRAIVANITNQAPPNPLPPAAQAANQGLCFDGTGNSVIACSLAPAGVISSAMAPVVGASTLAAGRTAFGLGTMATENINAGTCGGPSIQDDGAGNARVVPATAADSINTAVACNFHTTVRLSTGPITYTLSKASSSYFNGFTFTVKALTGVITVTPNAADNFAGVASGTSVSIPQGTTCQITTNAASTAIWYLTCASSQPSIAANASASALTLTLNVPSIGFRDTTLANGDALWATPAGGLSITIPSGATLGTLNSVPFRGWLFVAYNSGTPVLGVATCSGIYVIYPCAAWEAIQKTGTGITSGATASGTLYTSTGVSNTAVRIVGYFDYASGLGTAGTWSSNPTTLQVCMPPFVCKRPGDVVQALTNSTSTPGTTTSATFAALTTSQTLSITPTSAPNLIKAVVSGSFSDTGSVSTALGLQIARASTLIGYPTLSTSPTTGVPGPITVTVWDAPGAGTFTYGLQGKTAAGTLSYPASSAGSLFELYEIMG